MGVGRTNQKRGSVRKTPGAETGEANIKAMPQGKSALSLILRVNEAGELVMGFISISLVIGGVAGGPGGKCRFFPEPLDKWKRGMN